MPSFQDSVVLFILALLLFGPKKLPVLARELGKWVGEFRRASNEFKMQMEEELRQVEQSDRQKQIAAMEAAAPIAPPLEEPEHPHLPPPETSPETPPEHPQNCHPEAQPKDPLLDSAAPAIDAAKPLPIAISGELSIMPPATGLPVAQTATPAAAHPAIDSGNDALSGLLESIPDTENAAHG